MSRLCAILAGTAMLAMTGCLNMARPTPTARPPEPVKLAVQEPLPNDGSIWPQGPRGNASVSWVSDPKAHFKGDIVTIVISEDINAQRAASTTRERDQDTSAAVTQLFFPKVGSIGGNNANIAYTTKRTDGGTGSISNTGKVTANLAAQVTDVMPNGYLLLRAKKELMVSGEIQVITVTGIARPENITSPANQILSTDIADAHVDIDGTGPISDAQRRTITSRLADWFNLF